MIDKREIGRRGEAAAAAYLERNGYTVTDRNLRVPTGEIDIVATDKDGCFMFVEVKTRKNADYGYASEFVDKNKQRRLMSAAEYYLGRDVYMRFYIIEVYYVMKNDMMYITEINHIENAFEGEPDDRDIQKDI